MNKIYALLGLVLLSTSLIAQNNDTKKADKLFYRFEYVKAAEAYKNLADQSKGNDYVYTQLADCYYNMYDVDNAIVWYKRIATPNQTNPEVFFKYSQMLKSKREYEEANKQLVEFARLAPEDNRAKVFLKNPNYLPGLLDIRKAYDVSYLEISSGQSDFGGFLQGNTLYFASARNAESKKYGWLDQAYLDIYQATFEDNDFIDAVEVESLNTKYHDGPASLTKDGKTIYYSSESFIAKTNEKYVKDKARKNKMGQTNIFVAKKAGKEWGEGKGVSFSSGEYSTSNPAISPDGKTLYFASNMPGGLGGMDIWKVAVKGANSFGEPENLGEKVNTEANESFPFIDEDGNLYFASNGRVGLGGLDIFTINLEEDEEAINLGKPINSEKDDFSFMFNSEHKVAIISSNREGQDNLYMAIPHCKVEAIVNITDKETQEIIANANVTILDSEDNVISNSYSDANGQVNFNAECNKEYKLQIIKDGYENSKATVKPAESGEVVVDVKLTPIKALITDTEIILKEIIFDYDKSNITKDAAFILDNLVQIMKDYPEMIIAVGSHTDNRGSEWYNTKLSDNRAKSTVQYVISKGIDSERISGKGYGELEPKVDCKTKCTDEEHQINRRSEFKIVKK